MKQRLFPVQINKATLLFMVTVSLCVASCTSFKKNAKDVPKSYNIASTPKGMTNLEARNIYIDRYKAIAIREMERTGIPASIKLAQGILESDAGRSTLSSQYNNHFGIKCHSDWQGERYYQEDDDKDPVTGQLIKSCFRGYKNGDESFIAHSEFLRDPRKVNRYGKLFQLDPKDYASWANGLESSGYATASDYSEKLIRIIEDLQLHQFDLMSSSSLSSTTGTASNTTNNSNSGGFENPSNTSNNNSVSVAEGMRNDVKFLKINSGMNLEQIAGRYDISIKKLQEYNEEIGAPDRKLPQGTVIYTQKKRSSWNGSEKYHRVQQCETMFDISQKYGIRLSKLYGKNEMRDGDQPAIGEKIVLRKGWFQRVDMPALRDTFGDWKKCLQPDVLLDKPVSNPATTNRPTPPTTNNGEFGFEISPSGNNTTTSQPQSNYPGGQPTLPPSTYPTNTQPNYPTYPSNQPTYPSTETRPSYPDTRPTTPSTPQSKPVPTRPTQPATGSGQYYTVLQGETLWGISRKFNLTVDQLKQLNSLPDNIIKPGQQLRIK
jgi:flagellum-specific peptidoglycan hydrolase FlgJ